MAVLELRKAPVRFSAHALWLPGVFLLLIGWRILLPERGWTDTGPRAFADLLFAILFSAALAAGCLGAGYFLLRRILPRTLSFGETLLIAGAAGAGLTGGLLGAFGMLVGSASPLVKAFVLVWSVPAGLGLAQVWTAYRNQPLRLGRVLRRLEAINSLLLLSAVFVLLTCLLRALAPPWDPDGLIYHLEGPRLFLEAGRILPLPQNAPANYPMTLEMLYMAGMAFGSDTVARILHVTWLAVFLLASFCFARRFFGDRVARISVVILLGIPILPYWSTLAYADLGWAVFELLALYLFGLACSSDRPRSAVVLAGVFAGCAMGSKYLGVGSAGLLAAGFAFLGARSGRRRMWSEPAIFLLAAGGVAFPWYLKNWVGFGNPIYPLAMGIFPADPAQLSWLAYMQNGFGAGRSILDYLLLPVNIFARHGDFSTVGGTIEMPSLLFPIAVLLPFSQPGNAARALGGYAVLRLAFWAAGAQQIRLLLPLFPVLAILAAVVMVWAAGRLREGMAFRVLSRSLMGGLMAVSLMYQIIDTVQTAPWTPAFGVQSKAEWLAGSVTDFQAVRYIVENLPPDSRVMMLWDGRAYYCDRRCVPDTFHAQWTSRAAGGPDLRMLAAQLAAEGFTHFLVSDTDTAFLLSHDPDGSHAAAWQYFRDVFQPACATIVHADMLARVYRLDCP